MNVSKEDTLCILTNCQSDLLQIFLKECFLISVCDAIVSREKIFFEEKNYGKIQGSVS
jgi:hypothetical protein